jgi:hypothetical protein
VTFGQHPQFVWAEHIIRGAYVHEQRTGQYLFNHLPNPVAAQVRGTTFDPFHKDLTINEVHCWIQDHLIFDANRIIAVFNNDEILWEE